MDIFFCDLCGVRVTDADLRAGHGIRSRLDVICGKCLELGHGKEWLTKRRAQAAVGAVVGAPTMDAARDRAQTVEEDIEPELVEPRPVALDEADTAPDQPAPLAHVGIPEVDVDATPSSPNPVLGYHSTTDSLPMKTKRGTSDRLASAANMFSALGSSRKHQKAETDEIGAASAENSDGEDDLADSADQMASDLSPSGGNAVSPFADSQPAEEAAARRDSRPGSGRTPRSGNRKLGAASTSRPSTSARQRAAGAAKGGTGKSQGRSARRGTGGGKNSKVMMFSVVSIGVLILVFSVIMLNADHKKTGKTQTDNLTEPILKKIQETKSAVESALSSKDAKALNAAKQKISDTDTAVEAFEKRAVTQPGWTTQSVEIWLEHNGWPGTRSRMRNLNDELSKLH